MKYILTILLCLSLYAETPIKLGYCAYGTWSDNALQWYVDHAQLVVMGNRSVAHANTIKQIDSSILTFVYKLSINKDNDSHGVCCFDWIDVNHPDWFLLDDDSIRMTDISSDWAKISVFWMDWGHPGWQKHWTDDVVDSLENNAWDGIMSDIAFVNINPHWAPNGILQYDTNLEFNAAVESFHNYAYSRIDSMGKLLIPNSVGAMHIWNERLAHTHGGLDEGFVNVSQWNENIWRTDEEWEKQITNLETTCAEGKIYYAMAHNRGLNEQDLLFSLGSFLLGTDGEHGYFYNAGVRGYLLENFITDYEEFKDIYEIDIGMPIGSRYFEDNVWKRDFENGFVVVDLVSHTGLLLIDNPTSVAKIKIKLK